MVTKGLAEEREGYEQASAEAPEQRALAEERGRRGEAQDAELRDLRRQAGETAAELGQVRGHFEALRGQVEDLRDARARIEAERDQARAALQEAHGEAQERARRIEALGVSTLRPCGGRWPRQRLRAPV